jgi:hypothetical protein
VGHDDNGRISLDGAPLLAKSTTVAFGGNHDGSAVTFYGAENDGVVGTNFITDQTEFVLGPNQTFFFEQNRGPHLGMIFFLQREIANRLGGADLTADVTALFTGRQTKFHPRRP